MPKIFILSILTHLSFKEESRNHEISKTGTGCRNSPRGLKTFIWGQFSVDT